MTDYSQLTDTPEARRQRQQRRREQLNEIARRAGYETWTRLETGAIRGDNITIKGHEMNTIYNNDGTAARIQGDHSLAAVYATTEVINDLGGETAAFHEIKRLQNANMLPRLGSESRPLTRRDIAYARQNEAMGRRHWQHRHLQGGNVHRDTGYDFVYGYGYQDGSLFVLVDGSGRVEYKVEVGSAGTTN